MSKEIKKQIQIQVKNIDMKIIKEKKGEKGAKMILKAY